METISLIDAARYIAVSHVLLLTAIVPFRLQAWDRIYALMIGGGAAAFLVLPVLLSSPVPEIILLPVALLQIGLTFWIWLFALASRRADFKPALLHWGILVVKIVITFLWWSPRRPDIISMDIEERVIWRALIPILFSLVLTIAAAVVAGKDLSNELSNEARRIRKLLVFWGAGAIITTVLILGALRGPKLEQVGVGLTILLVLAICVSLQFLLHKAAFKPFTIAPAAPLLNETEQNLARRIEDCFREEEYFRTEGLTVTGLSSHLEEKEYKVRRAINQVLGYRNFNTFLNRARIDRAKETLLEEPELPVIRLSLDLGYRSLAGFNKAFKEQTNQTPTEYRRKNRQIP